MKNQSLTLEHLRKTDIPVTIQLIESVFDKTIAPTLSEAGITTFKSGLTEASIEHRLNQGSIFVVCRAANTIIGAGEIRNKNHLNLLFVAEKFQKCGIGYKIFRALLSTVKENTLTVNASLNAVDAYQKYGFVINGSANEIQGIKYQPMIYQKASSKA